MRLPVSLCVPLCASLSDPRYRPGCPQRKRVSHAKSDAELRGASTHAAEGGKGRWELDEPPPKKGKLMQVSSPKPCPALTPHPLPSLSPSPSLSLTVSLSLTLTVSLLAGRRSLSHARRDQSDPIDGRAKAFLRARLCDCRHRWRPARRVRLYAASSLSLSVCVCVCACVCVCVFAGAWSNPTSRSALTVSMCSVHRPVCT